MGGLIYLVPSTSNIGSRRIKIPRAGTITKVSILTNVNGTSMSASPSPTIQVFNNTTATSDTITTTNLFTGAVPFTRNDLFTVSIAVSEGDEVAIQVVIGNVTTEPTLVVMLLQVFIE